MKKIMKIMWRGLIKNMDKEKQKKLLIKFQRGFHNLEVLWSRLGIFGKILKSKNDSLIFSSLDINQEKLLKSFPSKSE